MDVLQMVGESLQSGNSGETRKKMLSKPLKKKATAIMKY